MITNTELENKGDQYPSRIISFEQDVDSIFFYTENNVILKITILRDSLIRFRYTTKGYFSNDFSYAIDKSHSHGYNFLEITEENEFYQFFASFEQIEQDFFKQMFHYTLSMIQKSDKSSDKSIFLILLNIPN